MNLDRPARSSELKLQPVPLLKMRVKVGQMMKPVIGANDKRAKVEIVLPFTAGGEVAFDENGKQVGGREPVKLTLPKFNFMPRPQLKAMLSTIDEIAKGKDDGKSDDDRAYDTILASLRPFIDDNVYELLADEPMGVLEQISTDWNEASTIPLGELRASTSSSKNTKARSTSTSSTTDSD